jgi:hypothetical protein
VPVIVLEQPLVKIEAEDAGEMAVQVQDARPVRSLDGRPDLVNQLVAGLHVDAGGLVREALSHAGRSLMGTGLIVPPGSGLLHQFSGLCAGGP